ncbi:expansin EXLX1 family cellulose-binding protein [Archangium lipolyticum]|uniref:expansin EXLX1 family cellulose-binding protein n=1 Tax=Archangium lipolyticum TaxID=2970465 RepID=UPI00214A7DE0|nr:expansin EXLX1 family cellulose-binding protein [Archangium lipolyticum]
MRLNKPASARWFAAALLPLLAACGPTDPGEALRALGEYQDGLITFYNEADGTGNCSFMASPQDLDVAAMNIGQYQDSAVCGACVQIDGPKGSLRVRIVDSCPDCSTKGHLDLSPSAFAKLAEPIQGRVNVKWRMVTCDVQGPIRYRFKDGSSQWWTGIQVLNHRLPVTKLEYWKNNAWVAVKRESYNYFVDPNGMGAGAIKVRVTASDGQTLEDTLPAADPNNTSVIDGAAQFKAG